MAGAGIGSTNNTGIWVDNGSASTLVARTGAAAPGVTGGVFGSLGDGVFSSGGRVAFCATLSAGVGVTSANNVGIWTNANGALALVTRTQSNAPGYATGARFVSFTKVLFPKQGGVMFLANLALGGGGVTAANNQGIWAVNTSGVLKFRPQ